MKFLKPGKVAIILRGRFAGKKVVIVRNNDEGTKEHPYGHAIVAGVERYPLRVTKYILKKIAKRSRVKPFVKIINYNHIMPTRYAVEFDEFKKVVTIEAVSDPTKRKEVKKFVRKAFEQRYTSGKNKWLFTKLRF
ncbi:60S ribosomal protein L27B [Massospora cicadina]|nr:60S ribosomal protein L27B [Massospora cicadina]